MNKRNIIYPKIIKAVLKYKSINFDVLKHIKPVGHPYKDFYLNFLPKEYSECFNFIKKLDSVIRIDVHDDFTIKGIKNSTNCFIESLLRRVSRDFTGENKGIKIRREKDTFFSTVKCEETGCILKMKARKYIREESNAILVSDMILGFHQFRFDKSNRKMFLLKENLNKKVFYRNITP